jgi:hypothetical protein
LAIWAPRHVFVQTRLVFSLLNDPTAPAPALPRFRLTMGSTVGDTVMVSVTPLGCERLVTPTAEEVTGKLRV